MEQCPFCRKHSVEFRVENTANSLVKTVECRICGNYKISLHDEHNLKDKDYDDKRHIFSGITRYNFEDGRIVNFSLHYKKEYLSSALIPKDQFEKMDRILLYISKICKDDVKYEPVDSSLEYPIAFAKDYTEFQRYLNIIHTQFKWVDRASNNGGQTCYRLNSNGWKQLLEIKKRTSTNQIFVAMPFDKKKMGDAWESGYEPAIKESKYTPFRVDKKQHNEKIDDEIIAGIRRSYCLVADVSYKNPGVYYEAGFAKGLGLHVIWTCKKRYFKKNKPHFDTQQYNHILWDNPEDLCSKLIARIKATLPIRETSVSSENIDKVQ